LFLGVDILQATVGACCRWCHLACSLSLATSSVTSESEQAKVAISNRPQGRPARCPHQLGKPAAVRPAGHQLTLKAINASQGVPLVAW